MIDQPKNPNGGLKLLILAFDCHPTLPSLPVVTFKLCERLGQHAEVTVVTHKQDDHIDVPGTTTVRIDMDAIKLPLDATANLLRGGNELGWTTKTAFTYPTYVAFERKVWKRFRDELNDGAFDAILRLSPMSPVLPSPLAKWSPVPTIIGPINGGLPYPASMQNVMFKEREWLRPIRKISDYLPFARSSYQQASAILAGFQHTIDDLPVAPEETTINFPEIGFDPSMFHPPAEDRGIPERLRFLYVGRLVPYKFPVSIVEAFAASPLLQQHHLEIVGDGPEREAIEALVSKHQLSNCVTLSGWTDQQGCAAAMRKSDLFVFPSIRELGAGVIIEALACALPCLVANYGAPGFLVNEDRGYRFELTPHVDISQALQNNLERAVAERDQLPHLRRAAHEFAQNYTWQRKAENLLEICDWVTGRIPEKPDPYPLDGSPAAHPERNACDPASSGS